MRKTVFTLLFIQVCLCGFSQLQTGEKVAIADTESGKVRGFIRNGIYTYKGIPYAVAERFELPRKPEPWEGIRSSMTYGPVAPLINPVTSVMDESEFVFDHDWGYTSEDCLVLNVWTPGIGDGKKRPVLFWIHGGGFTAGSSQELPSYHGENLAKKGDVVVVSVNHRLNMLGFLDLSAYGEKYRYSANHSILDLKVALDWVKTNIDHFGGDPGNVTIFGQSGGGAKVNTLMAMPAARGLFHKTVNQSGAFRMDMLEKPVTQEIAAQVLSVLDLRADEVDSLRTIPLRTLMEAGQQALRTVGQKLRAEGRPLPGFGLNWGPSRDGDLLPFQLFSEEAFELSKDIPLLIGSVKNEFMASLSAGLTNATMEEATAFIQRQRGEQADAWISAVRKAYPDDTRPSDLVDIDVIFRPGAVQQANTKAAVPGGAPVYMYLFAWQSPVLDGKYKAIHCIELPFVFNNIARCENMTGATPEAFALAEKVSQSWINFARRGNPGHSGLPHWEPYTADNGATMFFDDTCQVRHHHDKELLELASRNQP